MGVELLAGGGPGAIAPAARRAMGMPLVGQFDPAFTAIMDDVMALARRVLVTSNQRCLPVSGQGLAGLEALLNSLLEAGDRVGIEGGPTFRATVGDLAERYGAEIDRAGDRVKYLVVAAIDEASGRPLPLADLAATAHERGATVIVEATHALAATELLCDDWGLDACTASVDHALGAPAGMALVTYTPDLEASMRDRATPPPTSYLDLLQLQAYWSPERLNHHTAPTALVYGLREALRLVLEEGLEAVWARHTRVGEMVHVGLRELGLDVSGESPYAIVRWADASQAADYQRRLRDAFGISVTRFESAWRIGLLGHDAQPRAANRLLASLAAMLASAS
jgi:aspartate aminotransferase-like enzyme